jgi:hypothetical protein
MKVLAAMLLSLSLPGSQFVPKLRTPSDRVVTQEARNSGKWYLAETGHAVFCYGPVMTVQAKDGLQRVATFCRGDQVMVPVKD